MDKNSIDNIYKRLKTLNDDNFERMINLLSFYFYKEFKPKPYACYNVHEMLEFLSEKNFKEWWYQVNKCIDCERFFNLMNEVEKLLK